MQRLLHQVVDILLLTSDVTVLTRLDMGLASTLASPNSAGTGCSFFELHACAVECILHDAWVAGVSACVHGECQAVQVCPAVSVCHGHGSWMTAWLCSVLHCMCACCVCTLNTTMQQGMAALMECNCHCWVCRRPADCPHATCMTPDMPVKCLIMPPYLLHRGSSTHYHTVTYRVSAPITRWQQKQALLAVSVELAAVCHAAVGQTLQLYQPEALASLHPKNKLQGMVGTNLSGRAR
jgi:hypothetical protein